MDARQDAVTIEIVPIDKESDVNVIVGQAHFIKTIEDLYEAVATHAPSMAFGAAFCEASGACKVRVEGNDEALKAMAAGAATAVAAGHSFFIMLRRGFPIQVLDAVKAVPEVCRIFAATANPLDVIVAATGRGRGILGVIDGAPPRGVEDEEDLQWRKTFLRRIGYKR